MYNSYENFFYHGSDNIPMYGMDYNSLYSPLDELDYEMDRKVIGPGMREAISLIRSSIEGEREDEMFYDFLISEAPDQEQKDIITSIRDDERKHRMMFRNMYLILTGKQVPMPTGTVDFKRPSSYKEGLKQALFGELKAVEKYRKILFEMKDRRLINMITEILTDELKHAHKYNYLITINR